MYTCKYKYTKYLINSTQWQCNVSHNKINSIVKYQIYNKTVNQLWVQGHALFPTVITWVSEIGIWRSMGHTPLSYMGATGSAIMLDEWQIPGNSHSSHAHRHVLCPGGIVLRHHRKRPARTCVRKWRRGFGFYMTEITYNIQSYT